MPLKGQEKKTIKTLEIREEGKEENVLVGRQRIQVNLVQDASGQGGKKRVSRIAARPSLGGTIKIAHAIPAENSKNQEGCGQKEKGVGERSTLRESQGESKKSKEGHGRLSNPRECCISKKGKGNGQNKEEDRRTV